MLAVLLARRPESLIMVGSPATPNGATLLRRSGVPVVETWHLPPDLIDAIAGFDNCEAGVAVAQHLIGRAAAGLILSRNGPRRIDLGFELAVRDSGCSIQKSSMTGAGRGPHPKRR